MCVDRSVCVYFSKLTIFWVSVRSVGSFDEGKKDMKKAKDFLVAAYWDSIKKNTQHTKINTSIELQTIP